MEKQDKIVVSTNGEEKEIYPLVEVDSVDKKYIIYSYFTEPDKIEEDTYLGVLTGDTILPVSNDELEQFNNLFQQIII